MERKNAHFFSKEPLIHSHITDELPDDHPLAQKSVYCSRCLVMLHAVNNECMQTWFETEYGNFCTKCFKLPSAIESLQDCIQIGDSPKFKCCPFCGSERIVATPDEKVRCEECKTDFAVVV